MKILVINAGSSSLKYQLIDMDTREVISKGLAERIGMELGRLTHRYGEGCAEKYVVDVKFDDHTAAIQMVLDALVDAGHGVIADVKEIGAVGHRVLHGGDKFTKSCIVDDACKQAIRACYPLGPLHNPANLQGILACEKVMPGTPQVAVFDTAFHQTMPPKAFMYGVPKKYYDKHAVRRYGFHGTSHRYVSQRAAELLGEKGYKHDKMIIAHLGNGSSLSAVVDGKCVDTSMGLTPLEGVLMGTRSGSVDPAVVEFIANLENLSVTNTLTMLNRESGLLGISGVSSDMRDVNTAADAGNENAKLALDMWQYSVKKYIGAYAAAMGGLDTLIFTAGIGENDALGRQKVCEGLEFLGIKIDPEANKVRGEEKLISTPDSRVSVWVIPTNEELAIALDTQSLTEK
ncbi:MAG: acetate kinase [Clostridiales bacterium]|nr:acetate kinase [Clostridiales bacterium]